MNNFTKEWITSTCAPESVEPIDHRKKGERCAVGAYGRDMWTDKIYNENRTKWVKIFSSDTGVIGIQTSDTGKIEWQHQYKLNRSFIDVCGYIAAYFELMTIQLP